MSTEMIGKIASAIGLADDAFGYSFNMTKLIDGVATHTLTMDGFEPVDFEDRDDGYRLIAERRNRLRAKAILEALKDPSVDMIEASIDAREYGMTLEESANAVWQSMIDAALGENK